MVVGEVNRVFITSPDFDQCSEGLLVGVAVSTVGRDDIMVRGHGLEEFGVIIPVAAVVWERQLDVNAAVAVEENLHFATRR